ncbi:DNA mismatch repair protein PMS2, partial [Lecanoromycetidae sp. Uapishka_2]
MATIKALEGRTVHQIQSGQVIVDLCSVVKELVENSLDAGATAIEVRFKNNGLDSIEVQDNGVGISSDNYETIALKHYTSKLSSYDDLTSLQTFGFRGEALSSLCALSKFHIITAQAHEAPKGTRLDFETSGRMKATQVVASQKGTTVAVEDLFMNLPVRRRELERNIKREYGKVLGVLQAYACICTQARLVVSNVMAKGRKMTVFATKSSQSTRENIANVFGVKVLPGIVALDLRFEMQPTKTFTQLSDPDEDEAQTRSNSLPGLIENFVGRDSRERVNKVASVPVADTATKALSKDKQRLVKRLGREQNPPNRINDHEDDREFVESDAMLNAASKPVHDFNERIAEQQPATNLSSSFPQRSSNGTSQDEEHRAEVEERKSQTTPSPSVIQSAFDRMRPRRTSPETATITIGPKTLTSVLDSSSLSKRRRTGTPPSMPVRPEPSSKDPTRQKFSSSMRSFAAPGNQLTKTVGKPQSKSRISAEYDIRSSDDEESMSLSSEDEESGGGDMNESRDLALSENELDEDYFDEEDNKAKEDAKVAELIRQAEERSAMPSQDNKKRAHQILKATGRKDSTISLVQIIDASIGQIDVQLRDLESGLQESLTAMQKPKSEYQALNKEASAEERLSLTVVKNDFVNMQISGQFNLGFILANRSNKDLFIIDQHASDEKYNFERLQSTTIVQNQRLVQPRALRLTAIEEEIILENNEALLKNGFLVEINTSGDLPVGQRCSLLSLPMSREVTFDITDLEELLTLLSDSPTSSSNHIPRPSKVRRMFAMRACRSSVMIGKTLTTKQMGILVKHMSEIDKPWNCPHGRPTMRHVCGFEGWEGWKEGDGLADADEEKMGVEWGPWIERMMEKNEMEDDVLQHGDESDE